MTRLALSRSAAAALGVVLVWTGCVQILGADDDYVLGDVNVGGRTSDGGGGSGGEAGAGGDGGGGNDGGGGSTCGEAVPPTGGSCPTECNDGCTGDICAISCGTTDCSNLVCPAGFACEITCGNNDCRNANLTCPDEHACTLECSGPNACRDATLTCTDGPCTVGCTSGGCSNLAVACGSNSCAVDPCDGAQSPTLTCGESCMCSECG